MPKRRMTQRPSLLPQACYTVNQGIQFAQSASGVADGLTAGQSAARRTSVFPKLPGTSARDTHLFLRLQGQCPLSKQRPAAGPDHRGCSRPAVQHPCNALPASKRCQAASAEPGLLARSRLQDMQEPGPPDCCGATAVIAHFACNHEQPLQRRDRTAPAETLRQAASVTKMPRQGAWCAAAQGTRCAPCNPTRQFDDTCSLLQGLCRRHGCRPCASKAKTLGPILICVRHSIPAPRLLAGRQA